MSHTPISGRLRHLGLVRFAGADAIGFLQGQVSNDTRKLAQGAPILAAFSTAQGRVVSVLHLLPHSSGILAVLPRDVITLTVERLRKFVLRSKVKIDDVSDQYALIGAHGPAALQTAAGEDNGSDYFERDGIAVARLGAAEGEHGSRHWVVRPMEDSADAQDAPLIEKDWRLADIRAGLPQVYAATSEEFVAQMLNLDLIDGISFSKGCYTGQEIIARAQHLGRIKRRMFRLRLPPGAWSIGQPIRLGDGRSGRLTEVAAADDGFEALAVLSLEAGATDSGNAAGDAVAAAELPLPYHSSGSR